METDFGNLSTARQHLLRKIIFDLVQKTDRDFCYRCSQRIVDLSDFSIDHKVPWLGQDNEEELFFNLENIGYSHRSCNYKARRCALKVNNKTGYKGVTYYEKYKENPYRARIYDLQRKSVHIGSFSTAIEAAKAYDEAAVKLYKERAITNKMLGLVS